ncbi:hypothetical protein CLAIMM_12715, partial [Cladophialophora immunda]
SASGRVSRQGWVRNVSTGQAPAVHEAEECNGNESTSKQTDGGVFHPDVLRAHVVSIWSSSSLSVAFVHGASIIQWYPAVCTMAQRVFGIVLCSLVADTLIRDAGMGSFRAASPPLPPAIHPLVPSPES